MSRKRARRLATTVTVVAVLAVGGYTAAAALVSLPAPIVELSVETDLRVDADVASAQAALDGQSGVTAVGWAHGEEVWANSEEAVPIASLTKLVTVLVALEAEPVAPGADGTVHVWTAEDAARQEDYLARNGIAFAIPVGTEVTTRQMLQLALIPSANDFAAAYAYSVFGDNDAFVAAVNEWKSQQGLESLVLAEPTGMDEANVANAADTLRIARLALADPTIAEIVAMPAADLPWGIGTVESTNQLHGLLPGVVGVKTGSTDVAGYNLAAAQIESATGRALTKISVVLGRTSEEDRVASSTAVLDALDVAAQPIELVVDGEPVGVARTVDDIEVPLVARGAAATVLVPGESATRTVVTDDTLGAGPASQEAGRIEVASPTGDVGIPITTTAPIVEPSFWWRVTHPARVFGWS